MIGNEVSQNMFTVKKLSKLAGISIRTLHYYDQIGLLKPARGGANSFRYYSEGDLLRLQQILFFRELDFSLDQIREIMGCPEFDVVEVLKTHRTALLERSKRLTSLIDTVDKTIHHLQGEERMENKELFEGFSEEKQKQYTEEIRLRYGEKAFEGTIDWNSYTPEQKKTIKAESESIYRDLVIAMPKGSDSPEAQKIIARWHNHLRYFYEPSYERLFGLGQMYAEHPDFIANFKKLHPELPEFLNQAIQFYCKDK
jgi:DNA-binding transcriptional MerR regulator